MPLHFCPKHQHNFLFLPFFGFDCVFLAGFMQPDTYVCPQCIAPKKRFARYDVNTGKAIGGGLPPIGVIVGLLAGLGAVGALLVYGLQ